MTVCAGIPVCFCGYPHSDITRILELYVQAEMNELQEILEQNLMFASVHKAKTGIYKEKPSGGTRRIEAEEGGNCFLQPSLFFYNETVI